MYPQVFPSVKIKFNILVFFNELGNEIPNTFRLFFIFWLFNKLNGKFYKQQKVIENKVKTL